MANTTNKANKQQRRAASASAAFLLLGGGILVLLNVLGLFFNVRGDTTQKELFSLSKGSQALVKRLSDRMEIRAYFSADLPPPHNATERYVRDLLAEYREASGGKITVRFIHPVKDEDKQAAERDSVVRVQDQKLENDSFSVHEGYRGISFSYLGETRSIPRVDTTAGLEYSITQTIKQMVGDKADIGIITGHGGPGLAQGLSSLREYLPTYEMKEVTLAQEIPLTFKALLVIHPETPMTEDELRYIDQYVMRGGSLGVFGGMVKVDLTSQTPTATPVDTGLNKLLEKWGVTLGKDIVADAQCGRARLPSQYGIPIAVPYPPVPIITFDEKQSEHPALFRLDQIAMPYAVTVSLNGTLSSDKEVKLTNLANSTRASWLMKGDSIDLSSKERWEVPCYNGPFPVGAAVEGKLPSAFSGVAEVSTPAAGGAAPTSAIQAPERAEKNARVLVFGSGFFMRDEFLPKGAAARPDMGGSIAFALNAIDWLAQDSDLIGIRAKNVEDPALDVPSNVKEAENTIRAAVEEQDEAKAKTAFETRKSAMEAWDAKKNLYRWGNTLAIPLAFALFGIVRWRVRRARKATL